MSTSIQNLPLPVGYEALSPEEKIAYIQRLWDELTLAEPLPEVPQHQLVEVERRRKLRQERPDASLSSEESLRRLQERLKP